MPWTEQDLSDDKTPWSVRGIPDSLKNKLKEESKRTGQTVGRILTGLLADYFGYNDTSPKASQNLLETVMKRLDAVERKIEAVTRK